jgi:hypothetical protein
MRSAALVLSTLSLNATPLDWTVTLIEVGTYSRMAMS